VLGYGRSRSALYPSIFGEYTMFSLIYTIIIGAVIGVLARFFKPGADSMGWILTILLGIGGSWVGSYIAPRIGLTGSFTGFAVSIACAVGLLFLYEFMRKKTK
jgi:uncharacterized membrane protein YeaQ/YmgE (transglycosylase-associated protein family)